jgi:integrase
VTIQEAMDSFEKESRRRGLSTAYVTKSRAFFSQFCTAFRNCLMSDVTVKRAKDYIYGNKSWGAVTKNSHIRHLRALYAATIKAGHATLNPFKEVAFVKVTGNGAGSKVLSVDDAQRLLDFALKNGRKSECATLALVLFCGVRMEETSRVTWEEISLESEKPRVRVEKAKNNQRRVNDIPTNAVHWLRECQSKGRVAPENFEKVMQRLRQKAKVPYKQNAARHSFASYHVALHDDAAKTAILLGHPNPSLLYKTYRECVSREEAVRFFDLFPKGA